MIMTWSWLIAIYLFLGGLGAGAFLTSASAEALGRDRHPALAKAGALISGPIVLIGCALLVLDLGAGLREPWRLVFLYISGNLASPMTWGVIILTLFVPVAFLYGIGYLEGRRLARLGAWSARHRAALGIIGSLLAVATGVYTGVLLAVVPGVPLLGTPILPVLFLVSALSTGLAASLLGAHLVAGEATAEADGPGRLHVALIVAELGIVLAWLGSIAASSEAGSQSVGLLVFGGLAAMFWIGVVAVGLVGPSLAFLASARKRGAKTLTMAGDTGVLVGGLILRYLVLAAAIPQLIGPAL